MKIKLSKILKVKKNILTSQRIFYHNSSNQEQTGTLSMISNSNPNEESNQSDKNDINWLKYDLASKQELPNYSNALNSSYSTTASHLFQSPPDYLNAIALNKQEICSTTLIHLNDSDPNDNGEKNDNKNKHDS